MMRALEAAISGLNVSQDWLDVTGNNIANVNTVGYKSSSASFADTLSETERGASAPTTTNGGSNPVQIGLGVTLESIDSQMTAGSLESTGNPLDVAIQGNGFLRVGTGQPPTVPTSGIMYTKAGNLTINQQGYLTTQNGAYIIGKDASPANPQTTPPTWTPSANDDYIQVPALSSNVTIGQDGSVTYLDGDPASATYGDQVTAGYLSLSTFPNAAGLQRMGNNLWASTANSGTETVGTPNTGNFGATLAGELEMSNVDLATEFTNMITAERGYEANARVITTADQMLQTTTQMVQ
jgi:flagellar hook protein FlgE